MLKLLALALICSSGVQSHLPNLPAKWPTLDNKEITLFGHRGAKSYQPQHTVGSYWFGAIHGDDFIEPDLVLTKDGIPVCYHDLYIKEGTDVEKHPEFAHLKRNYTGELDNHNQTITDDWFISDFTLAELKKLRVRQKVTGVRPQFYNKLFTIPTFQEFLDNANLLAYHLKKPINIVPELKHTNYHYSLYSSKYYFEDKVLQVLKENGYPVKKGDVANCHAKIPITSTATTGTKCAAKELKKVECGKVVIQSFDIETSKRLSTKVDKTHIELAFLNDDDPIYFTYKGLDEIAKYVQWFGPWKEYLYVGVENELNGRKQPFDVEQIKQLGGFLPGNKIPEEAHKRGLKVVLYTFYDSREVSFRGCNFPSNVCDEEDARAEYRYYFGLGVDGLFVESPAEAIQARAEYNTELRLNATRS